MLKLHYVSEHKSHEYWYYKNDDFSKVNFVKNDAKKIKVKKKWYTDGESYLIAKLNGENTQKASFA